jgi:UDP-glucose 4-epimerase
MEKVLITGGAGFLGAHLARALLAEGSEVELIDNFSRGTRDRWLEELRERGAVLRELDLLREDSFSGLPRDYSRVFHLAAIVGVRNVLDHPYDVLSNNVRMLEHVIAFCHLQRRLDRLVFASTSEVYAGTLQHFTLPVPTPEDTPIAVTNLAQPRATYLLSKIYGEALCHQSGIPFTIVRPHNVYGPRMGMAHVIPELLKQAHLAPPAGELAVSSPSHRRTFCYVDDAIRLIGIASATSACRSETLNVGAQSPEISIDELAGFIVRAVGKRLRIAPLPDTPGSPQRRCPDMSKTTRLTGYAARTGLEEGIRSTYDWYRPTLNG